MFEVLGLVDLGHAKGVQKEYENVNEVVGKWFKKVAVSHHLSRTLRWI